VEGILDADMISLLNSTPEIVRKQSGVVRQTIDPSDWVKLLTMQDPMSADNLIDGLLVFDTVTPYPGL
jgi:hypothetical protein